MNDPANGHSVLHYFVDEAGDPVLFSPRGKPRIGTEGCSLYFALGKLDVADPEALGHDLEELRAELLADPWFKTVPSMQPEQKKTALCFHAKDDVQEVRREVFKALAKHDLRFYAVVRDKRDLLTFVKQRNQRDPKYRYCDNELYDTLTTRLFDKFHRMADEVRICFAKRGKKPRTEALKAALEEASCRFERSFGFRSQARVLVESSTPVHKAGLQAVDYFLWALQRFYERQEERYLSLIWPTVGEIQDLDFLDGTRKGAFWIRSRPLTLAARAQKNSR